MISTQRQSPANAPSEPHGGSSIVPADRVDLIVDFSQFPAGARVRLANVLPMFNGRKPERGETQNPDDPDNQLMEFRVVGGAVRRPEPGAQLLPPAPAE